MSSFFSRRSVAVAGLGLAGLVLSACGNTLPSGTAATVDGEVIGISVLNRIVDSQSIAEGLDPASEGYESQITELTRRILGALISFEITEDVAEARGLEATEQELDDEYDVQIGLAGGEAELEAQLVGLGLTDAEYRDLILQNIVLSRELQEDITADVQITDEEVQAIFEERAAAGQYDTAIVSHILIGFGDTVEPGAEPDAAADAAAEQAARDVLERLADGEAFEELAVELSDDPGSGANGGSLGESPLSRYVPEFAAAAAEATVGEVVGPVRTDFGYHLIRVDERNEVVFADVEEQIRTELASVQSGGAFESELLAAVAAAEVVIPARIGVWDPESGTITDGRAPVDDLVPNVDDTTTEGQTEGQTQGQ